MREVQKEDRTYTSCNCLSGSVAPPPEDTQSGGYRSSAAGSSPDGLSSRLTVAR